MALFTGRGDDGTTYKFNSDKRFSKSSAIAEALGDLDELNSFLGFVKIEAKKNNFAINDQNFFDVVFDIQKNLFIVQAHIAGSPNNIDQEKIYKMENLINSAEKQMPVIKTFFISGGCRMSSLLDFSRTIARRSERSIVRANEEGLIKVAPEILSYINRLSSLLYAMARLSNHLSGINEEAPDYK